MSQNNEEIIANLIEVIAKENNFSENAKIKFNCGTNKGEGFIGEIVSVTLEDESTKRSMDFIVKMAAKDKNVRGAAAIEELFQNEIQVYETMLPALEKLQQTAKIPKPFSSIAKCYKASKAEECIILEDLKMSGFEMLHSRQLLDENHMRCVLSRYGEFHALSFALKILQPQKFREISSELKNMWGLTFTKQRNGRIILKLLESIQVFLKGKGFENKHFNNNVDNFNEWVTKMIYNDETKYSCFVHGDCWTNNFMFKYKTDNGEKTLEEFKLLDWQYCYVGPPVHDLSLIIFSSASKEIFENLDTYLLVYHESLTKFLEYFNLDVNEVYPLQELKRQWKQYYHFGLMLGSNIWRLRSVDEKDAIDTVNFSAEDGSTYFDALPDTKFDEDYLVEHMKILFEYLDKNEE